MSISTSSKRYIFWGLIVLYIPYSIYIYTSGTAHSQAEELRTEEAWQGKLLYEEYNCVACHQMHGLGGYMGPDITNVITTEGKGANYARAFIKNGTVKMPNFNLSDEEANALIAWLTYVGNAVDYPPTDFEITPYGTVNITEK